MIFPKPLLDRAEIILEKARQRRMTVTTAESCTGGLISGVLTEIPGASDVIDRGFIVYSNEAKRELLGVPQSLLEIHGAVSEPVARAMAEGATRAANADLAVAVTGIAGPSGGSATKPVGRVHLALAGKNKATYHVMMDYGAIGRSVIRLRTVETALGLLECYFSASAGDLP